MFTFTLNTHISFDINIFASYYAILDYFDVAFWCSQMNAFRSFLWIFFKSENIIISSNDYIRNLCDEPCLAYAVGHLFSWKSSQSAGDPRMTLSALKCFHPDQNN